MGDYTTWSDEDLAAEEARLAEERTAVRLAQNAVSSEREIRRAIAALTPETRRVLTVRLGGEIGPVGGVAAKESKS